jgi:DNA repair protein RadC
VQVGQRLLQKYGGIRGLHRADYAMLLEEHGLAEAKASTLKAAIELGRRLTLESPEDRPTINSPADAAALVQLEMQALEKEHLKVILLDTRNHVIEIREVYRGSLNASVVRVSEVFTPAVRRNAASILVVHNHPSGNPSPSPEDVAITKRLVEAGKLMEIEVLDHIIIGQGRYVSMKERGLGFTGQES